MSNAERKQKIINFKFMEYKLYHFFKPDKGNSTYGDDFFVMSASESDARMSLIDSKKWGDFEREIIFYVCEVHGPEEVIKIETT
jgi:hypothetical protein